MHIQAELDPLLQVVAGFINHGCYKSRELATLSANHCSSLIHLRTLNQKMLKSLEYLPWP